MKLVEIKVANDTYVVNGDMIGQLSVDDIDVFDNVEVFKNNEIETQFGETFSGNVIDSYDLLFAIIAAYFNDDTTIEYVYICDEIKALKDNNQTFTYKVGDRQIPDYVLSPSGNLHIINAITVDAKEQGNVFYTMLDKLADGRVFRSADSVVMTRLDGSVATDVEFFMTNALIGAACNNDIFIYVDDETKTWLEERLEEEGREPKLRTE